MKTTFTPEQLTDPAIERSNEIRCRDAKVWLVDPTLHLISAKKVAAGMRIRRPFEMH